MGFLFDHPRIVSIPDENPSRYVQAIRENVTDETQLVLVMTPGMSQREDRYSAIKKLLPRTFSSITGHQVCNHGWPKEGTECGTESSTSDAVQNRRTAVGCQDSLPVGHVCWHPSRIFVYRDGYQRYQTMGTRGTILWVSNQWDCLINLLIKQWTVSNHWLLKFCATMLSSIHAGDHLRLILMKTT